MENTTTNKETKEEKIKKLQEIVDTLREAPQYTQYIKQRKLHLIDSRLANIDLLLTLNVLK